MVEKPNFCSSSLIGLSGAVGWEWGIHSPVLGPWYCTKPSHVFCKPICLIGDCRCRPATWRYYIPSINPPSVGRLLVRLSASHQPYHTRPDQTRPDQTRSEVASFASSSAAYGMSTSDCSLSSGSGSGSGPTSAIVTVKISPCESLNARHPQEDEAGGHASSNKCTERSEANHRQKEEGVANTVDGAMVMPSGDLSDI
ncbi:uncharacterized protein BO97DRAFT_105160 [Aspergillus homomorphus CBS 101889]|uniref:Uncharacterized protein n=1 Tax=Aspergillus homomorphus (strain CBS 101889) TaxID=1450537 RepID=A0A395HUN7_ASPHC|nr:hypothetical protein BO97DRAFT_105160 [Aspergillus homomorphus CBS 101889]RAL11133.1 hypothetical protein BO97DRAFT_105160 [Aspergillus homomorphus CBS 101889]